LPETSEVIVSTQPVTAIAHANIALIKYWGKRTEALNLPAVGSISLTLDALRTETTVYFDDSLKADQFILDEQTASEKQLARISRFFDTLFNSSNRPAAKVESINHFPTGAGLASSASGFAALTVAAANAMGLSASPKQLSQWARIGSGSAARSIFGGFVEMKCGNDTSGKNDFAIPLHDENYWDVRLLIAITSQQHKNIGSTDGMQHTAQTSPYYNDWIQNSAEDLTNMRKALGSRDFTRVGELTEHSCFKMHGLAMSARPPLLYWNAATVQCIHAIWNLRNQGVEAYVTIDAGPQIKVLCQPAHAAHIKETLNSIDGVQQVMEAKPGSSAYVKTAHN
jgi:diphosphomevalonate decarboxylase